MKSLSARPPSSNSASRPSLYAEAAANGNEMQGDSILGELEQNRPRRKKLAGVLVMALTGALIIGWWQAGGPALRSHPGAVELAASVDASKSKEAALPPAPAPAPAAVQAAADTATGQPVEENVNMPAMIVAEAAPVESAHGVEAVTPQAAIPDKTAFAGGAETAPAAAVPREGAAPARDPAPAMAAAAAESITKTPVPELARVAANKSAPGKEKESVAGSARNTAAAANGKATAKKDGDVELIAALLNRISPSQETPRAEAMRKTGAAKAQSRAGALEKKKGRKTANLDEILASKPVDTTESQLKRCASLGFFEGELCRFRICDGRWGQDAACPASPQISAAGP